MSEIKVGFGLADIKVDGEDIGLQGDAATFSAEPIYLDVETYEVGLYDLYLDGWDVKLTVNFQQEDFDKLKMAMPALDDLKDEEGNVKGLTDSPLHKRMRDRAKEITIHSRDAGDDESYDITIFKAFPTGAFERVYGKEVVTYEVEFIGLPVSGDSAQGGRYFRIGTDGEATP